MKTTAHFFGILIIASFFCCRNHTDVSKLLNYNGQMSIEHAHPNAQQLLAEDFYWSAIEETGPLGSDAGSDAFYGYRNWRRTNMNKSPVEYLKAFYANWNLDLLDLNEDRDSIIIEYINKDHINGMIVVDMDNAAISTGFGQFMLEGKIDPDIKSLTIQAITREQKLILLQQFDPQYAATRKEQLEKMALIVNKMDTHQ